MYSLRSVCSQTHLITFKKQGSLIHIMINNKNKIKKPHYSGHRKRLREKYLRTSQEFPEYELLELILMYSIPRKDVKPLAKDLLTKFKSLPAILSSNIPELLQCNGITENSATLFKLIHECSVRISSNEIKNKDLLDSPTDVINFAKAKIGREKNEACFIIYLNTKNRLQAYEIINEGTINQVVIYPRNLIKTALEHNATGIIVIHNHPSGECDPSGADIRLTESIKKASTLMGIKLVDHIIITSNDYFSFLEEELL